MEEATIARSRPRLFAIYLLFGLIVAVSACRIESRYPLFSQSAFIRATFLPATLKTNGAVAAVVAVASNYPGVPVYTYNGSPKPLSDENRKKYRDYIYTCSQSISGQECPNFDEIKRQLERNAEPAEQFLFGLIPIADNFYAAQVVKKIQGDANENDVALVRVVNDREIVWMDDISKCARNERPAKYGLRFQRNLDLTVKLISSSSDERSIAFFRDCIATEELGVHTTFQASR